MRVVNDCVSEFILAARAPIRVSCSERRIARHFLARRAGAVGVRQPAFGLGGIAGGRSGRRAIEQLLLQQRARFPRTPGSSGMIWRAASR